MREMQPGIDLFIAARVVALNFCTFSRRGRCIGGNGTQRDTRSSCHIGRISARVNVPPRNNISLATSGDSLSEITARLRPACTRGRRVCGDDDRSASAECNRKEEDEEERGGREGETAQRERKRGRAKFERERKKETAKGREDKARERRKKMEHSYL